ncbi:MAG: RlmE family RNA methyltransferase [Acidiferrobacterales bacterium]|nr:RlmE family RNA methyltransferase [Acidiferrobacterales bacterium]
MREAVRLGVRSRSYFKIQEMDHRFNLFSQDQTVLDLGASPGGWCQYAVSRIGSGGTVFAVDVLELKPLDQVHFIQSNITEQQSRKNLAQVLGTQKVNLVLSDMAPNLTGISSVDSRNFSDLYEAIYDVCDLILDRDGTLVFKFFRDHDSGTLRKQCESRFEACSVFKPKASRSRS